MVVRKNKDFNDIRLDEKERFSDYLEYRRGRQDGSLGRPITSLREVYIEGYIIGRKLASMVRREPN